MLTQMSFGGRTDDAPLLRENLERERAAYAEQQLRYLKALGKTCRGRTNGDARAIRKKLKEQQKLIRLLKVGAGEVDPEVLCRKRGAMK